MFENLGLQDASSVSCSLIFGEQMSLSYRVGWYPNGQEDDWGRMPSASANWANGASALSTEWSTRQSGASAWQEKVDSSLNEWISKTDTAGDWQIQSA